MLMPWRAAVAVVLAWAACASAAAESGDAVRGRALYDGTSALRARTADGTALPPAAAACVACHRRSGLGSFEGGVAAPPITGKFLFEPLSATTGHIFPWPSTLRTRPAYDLTGLQHLLADGTAPDGVVMRAPMPRYAMAMQDVADLAAYLRELSKPRAPGVTDSTLDLATIVTPGVPALERQAVVDVLAAYFEQKNAQTRHESGRARVAERGQLTMYRNYRQWRLVVWDLTGPPDTWRAQLDALYRAQPVFAVVGGIGHGSWAGVQQFCETQEVPCLFPITQQPPGEPGYYSVYFHGGWAVDAQVAADALQARGVRRVAVWAGADDAQAAERVRQVLAAQGLRVTEPGADPAATAQAVVSLLDDAAQTAQLKATPQAADVWMVRLGERGGEAQASAGARALWVRAQLQGAALQRQMQRPRSWLQKQGLSYLPINVATSTLYAASVAGESLMHIDLGFSREYCIEKLEHNLENTVPLSPYPRLSLGPDQRIASKGSFLGVVGQDGRIVWDWRRP